PERRYWHPVLGFNYRLTNLQAALGVAQMERVEEILERKRTIARLYDEALGPVPGLRLPPRAPWAENVHWLYSVLVDGELGVSRDEVVERLAADGCETRPFFVPCHRQPLYESGQRLPVAEDLAARGLSLPSAVSLSDGEIRRVAHA